MVAVGLLRSGLKPGFRSLSLFFFIFFWLLHDGRLCLGWGFGGSMVRFLRCVDAREVLLGVWEWGKNKTMLMFGFQVGE